MKRPLLIISLLTLFISGVFAQKLIIQDTLGNDVTGTTIEYGVVKNADFAKIKLNVINNTTASMDVKVKKVELSLLDGTQVYMCWESCYSPMTFEVPTSLPIAPGAICKNFEGDISYIDEITGTTTIKYVFFDAANTRDTSFVIVNYNIGAVGIKENLIKSTIVSNAYPNPARSSVSIDYKLPVNTTNAKIKVSNLLGTAVKSIDLTASEGKATIDVSTLDNGVYFYSVMINNTSAVTRKFVINR